jgi:hypothetical protein
MNNHLRKVVVASLAVVASIGVSGCKGGSGGIFGLFDGSSFGDLVDSSGNTSNEGNEGGPETFFLSSLGGEQGGENQTGGPDSQNPGLPPPGVIVNPEPASIGLFSAGLVALGAARRRKAARRSNRG